MEWKHFLYCQQVISWREVEVGEVRERITESTVNVARCTCRSEITEKIGEKLIG